MKYLGAYMLAVIGGKSSPASDDIKKILESAGIAVDDTVLTKVMGELEGKDIMEVMAAGKEKLASVPAGGGAAAGGGGGGAGGAAEDAPAEEAKAESEEEEEEEMDFDLFD